MRICLTKTTARRTQQKFGLFALFGLALLGGCSSEPKQVPPDPYIVAFQADPKVNPDSYGRPSPTKVVFYELRSPVIFETSDFFSLSQKDQSVLGSDLVSREEFFIRPGDMKTLSRKGSPGTTTLGVFVEFRDIDKSIWHATTNVLPPDQPGMFSMIGLGSSHQKNYQIQIDQHSVKFVAVTNTASNASTATSISMPSAPTIAVPTVPN